MTDQPDLDLPAEITEFTSLVRARLAGVFDETNPPGRSPGETLWNDVHGIAHVEASSMKELADKLGEMLFVKRHAAVLVTAMLAIELAKQTGRSALDHINDVEQALIDGAPS